MKRVLALSIFLGLSLLLLYLLGASLSSPVPNPDRPAVSPPVVDDISGLAHEELVPSERDLSLEEKRRALPDLSGPKNRAPHSNDVVIRGRCIDERGQALAGVRTTLRGWSLKGTSERSPKGGRAWKNPEVLETADDGLFEFSVDPPADYGLVLNLVAVGLVGLQTSWEDLQAGAVVDLGDCELCRGCLVQGVVKDSDGRHLGNKTIHLDALGTELLDLTFNKLIPGSIGSVETDAAGHFQFRKHVTPGAWRFTLYNQHIVAGRDLEIGAEDRELLVQIVTKSDAQRLSIRGRVVDDRGRAVPGARVDAGGPSCFTDAEGNFVLRQLNSDEKTKPVLEVRKKGFENYYADDPCAWGSEELQIQLRRGLTIAVMVTDAEHGVAVEDFGVYINQHGKKWRYYSSDNQGLRQSGHHKGGRVELAGLCRGEYEFQIIPNGSTFSESPRQIVLVGEGEANEIIFRLLPPGKKTIRLVTSDGEAVAGSKIELLEPIAGESVGLQTLATPMGRFSFGGHVATRWRQGTSDASGELELSGPRQITFALRVLGPGHLPMVVQGVSLDDAEEVLSITVALGAILRGSIKPILLLKQMRALAGDNTHARQTRPGLQLSRGVRGKDFESFPIETGSWFPVAGDGSFEISGLGTGSWDVLLCFRKDFGGSLSSTRRITVGRVLDLREGEQREHHFDVSQLLFSKLSGTVFLNGEPFAGRIRIGTSERGEPCRSDKQGRFDVLLLPGRYHARIYSESWLQAAETIHLQKGLDREQDIHIVGVGVKLRILGTDDMPIIDVHLQAKRDGDRYSTRLGPSDSTGLITGMLVPGDYELLVRPKHLSTPEAWQNMRSKKDSNEDAIRAVMVQLGTVRVAVGNRDEHQIRLPRKAGYE